MAWIVYTQQGSVEVLQVTGSLLHQILLCCLMVVHFRLCLSFEGKQTCCEKSLPGSLHRLVNYVGNRLVYSECVHYQWCDGVW